MNFDQSKWDDIVKQWEEDQPDVSDIDTPPVSDAPTDNVLPTLDFTSDAPDAAPAQPAQPPLRLRPDAPETPATVGAGQKGSTAMSPVKAAEPTASPKPPPPPESLDWKGLQDRLGRAESSRSLRQAAENMFANVGALSGYRPNAHAGEAEVAQAKLPMEMAQAKQQFESRDLANQKARGGIAAESAMKDPNSLQSQKAREAIRASFPGIELPGTFDNWSAADVHQFVNTGALQSLEGHRMEAEQHKAEAAAKAQAATQKAAEEQATLDSSRKSFAADLKKRGIDPNTASQKDIDRVLEDLRSRENAEASRNLTAAGRQQLPAGEAAKLGSSDAAIKAVNQLSKDWDELASGFGSGAKQYVPGTDANAYLPNLDTTTQVVGTYLEGGKLTDMDIPKYKRMMPQPTDTARQKAMKIEALNRLISTKRAEEGKALEGSGYKVPPSDVGGGIRTRPMKNGWTAYSKDGKRWFTTQAEAEAH